jgi:hypothetical protein
MILILSRKQTGLKESKWLPWGNGDDKILKQQNDWPKRDFSSLKCSKSALNFLWRNDSGQEESSEEGGKEDRQKNCQEGCQEGR